MRRQSMKAHRFVSGLFFISLLGAMAAFFGQTGNFGFYFIDRAGEHLKEMRYRQVPALQGHWLKTAADKSYTPASLDFDVKKTPQFPVTSSAPAIFTLEQAKARLNQTTDCINIMYIWSDDAQLKVISVTSFNKATKQASIVVIPLHSVIDNGPNINIWNRYTTVQDLYKAGGREGVRNFLEQKLEIKIPNFVQVNQSALKKLSDIIGVFKVHGDETTMLEAFEQTAAGIRTDDREVVEAVATQVMRPGIILEVPKLLYIFTHDIQTNFSTQEMVEVFYMSRKMDLKAMRKTALPGYEYHLNQERKLLFVSEHAWKNIIYDNTAAGSL